VKIYVFYTKQFRQGECEYDEPAVVQIEAPADLTQDQIEKLIVKRCLSDMFGEDSYSDKSEPNRIWESMDERYVELRSAKKISQADYDNLAKFLSSDSIAYDETRKKHQYCIDLQSFMVNAYSDEEAKAEAIRRLEAGEESAAIDQVVDEGEVKEGAPA
jgi:hypothetical protein